jgi:hypothetical protein
MAIIVEMEPETERLLTETAERLGMDAGGYTLQLIHHHLIASPTGPSLWESLSPEEWVRRAIEYHAGHDPNLPTLPDSSVTRDGLYGEHW